VVVVAVTVFFMYSGRKPAVPKTVDGNIDTPAASTPAAPSGG